MRNGRNGGGRRRYSNIEQVVLGLIPAEPDVGNSTFRAEKHAGNAIVRGQDNRTDAGARLAASLRARRFEIRVTFYNQQVRALNLIHALRKLPLPEGARIAVVGAGASGLTAAAAAAIWGSRNGLNDGWQVVVLVDRPDILALIGHGSARWIHPQIYEWPSESANREDAGLCIMDWKTGTAGAVIDCLRPKWGKTRE